MSAHRFLPLLVVLLTSLSTYAYDFQSGDLYYNITGKNTVEVTFQKRYYDNMTYDGLATATIPETVTHKNKTYSVTSIGEGAFCGCDSLTSITIPNSVTSIGDDAFDGCSSITSITIPNSVTNIGGWAFSGCYSLTSITIPNSVNSIGDYAFQDCRSLTSITIPNSVTSIGEGAFAWCFALTAMVVESGNTTYDSRENCNAIIETATNTLIAGCQSTIIPNSVTSIGSSAFWGCSSLTSITIPNSVKTIGQNAFTWCSALTSITIPNSVNSIGKYAFSNVPNIVYHGKAKGSPWGAKNVNGYVDGYLVYTDDTKTKLLVCSAAANGEITIHNSVTSIGDRAFYGCSALTSIILPNSVTSIGRYAFQDCRSLTYIIIPNSVTSIGDYAFQDCRSLTSITIPNSVTSIGDYAFHSCSALTSIILPNSVTSIGDGAFQDCHSLTSITIPNSVKHIGSCPFSGCNQLKDIYCYATTPPNCYYSFDGVDDNCRIHVPESTINSYRMASGWCVFKYFHEVSEE